MKFNKKVLVGAVAATLALSVFALAGCSSSSSSSASASGSASAAGDDKVITVGTYLVWVDISATGLDSTTLADRLLHDGHVMISAGTMYGQTTGRDSMRINIACPRNTMIEGLQRIVATIKPLIAKNQLAIKH